MHKLRDRSIALSMVALLALAPCYVRAYSLADFEREALDKDPAYKSVRLAEQASEYNLRKAEAPMAIRVFSEDLYYDDSRPVLTPAFQGARNSALNLSLGLEQQSRYGFNWNLSQNIHKTKFFGVMPGTFPQTDFWDFYPQLQLTIPLWRNFYGGEVRAQSEALKQTTQLQRLQAQVDRANKEADIETTFYRYGIQSTLLDLASRNLDRSQRLSGIIRNRRQQNLVDDVDEQQTHAALALRKLEFDQADRNARIALATLNSSRGVAELASPPTAPTFAELDPRELEALTHTDRRSLVESLRNFQIEAQRSQARADIESYTPKLDLTSGFVLQGRNDTLGGSISDMNAQKRNLWSVGLSFSAPLDFGLTHDLQRGGQLTEDAAGEALKRSDIDQKLSWVNERESLLRCAQSLTLLRELEGAQRQRFAGEEKMYRNGRATLFVVLSAEQDLINAQSQRWGNELQCRIIKAQTRLFAELGTSP